MAIAEQNPRFQLPSKNILLLPEANWNTFATRLERFPETARLDIHFAYEAAKGAHRNQTRLTGERYFEHLRSTALILLDECNIKDPRLVVTAILHDTLEDTSIFGRIEAPYSQRIREARYRLSVNFGEETAEIIIALSKPRVDGVEILTKKQSEELYLSNLSKASPETLLVKMADRLHNLRTLYGMTPEKQKEIIEETEKTYIPLFLRAYEQYPEETNQLITEIQKAIAKLSPTIISN